MKRMDLSDLGLWPREKRQHEEHNISCHSQEVSVAMTASTSLSAGPSNHDAIRGIGRNSQGFPSANKCAHKGGLRECPEINFGFQAF